MKSQTNKKHCNFIPVLHNLNKIYLLLLICTYTLVSCNNKGEIPDFVFDKLTTIKVSLENIQDSVDVSITALKILPKASSYEKINMKKNSANQYIQFSVECPKQITISIEDSVINAFVIPSDTLMVHVVLSDSNKIANLTFSGKTKDISEYYFQKQKDLGYYDFRFPMAKMLKYKTSLNSIAQLTDSMINNERNYFETYLENHQFPEWFVEMEKSIIVYHQSAKMQLHVFKLFFNITEKPDKDYFKFLTSLPVNNPKAVFAPNYNWFLDDYFLLDYPKDRLDSLNGYNRVKSIIFHIIPLAEKRLTGLVKDVYLAQKLHIYLEQTINLTEADSLLNHYKNSFSDQKYFNFLKSYRSIICYNDIDAREAKNKVRIIKKILKKGEKAPYFYLADEKGNFYSPQSFKGKVVYLNFWASWCGSCILAMPDKFKLIEKYKGKNIVFVNICVKDKDDKWLKAIKKYNVLGTNLFAKGNWSNDLYEKFGIKGIPHYVLIDKNGNIYQNSCDGPLGIESQINNLLSE